MKFSIVTTVADRPELLSYALYCIQQQIHTDWELIVVADGPQPDAEAIYRTFRARSGLADKLLYRQMPKKEGAWGNHCRREALRYATGDYVVWFGHDCLIDKDYLSTHAENIEKHGGPCVSVVHQQYNTPQTWAKDLPMSEHIPVFVRVLPDQVPGHQWNLGQIDLLNFSVPLGVAREYAWLPQNDMVYEGDWLSFVKFREVLPFSVSEKVVCGHF